MLVLLTALICVPLVRAKQRIATTIPTEKHSWFTYRCDSVPQKTTVIATVAIAQFGAGSLSEEPLAGERCRPAKSVPPLPPTVALPPGLRAPPPARRI
jgi:hypothetical protein